MNAKEAILDAIARFSPGADPSALFSIAKRESAFTPGAIGDTSIAPGVYERLRGQLRDMGNPWADTPERWGGSFGLYQLMAPYFARLWHPRADPYDLFDPRKATVAAGRLWNKAIELGATNPVEVRLVWAYGPKGLKYGPGTTQYDSRLKTERNRFASLGYPADYATRDAKSFGYSGFGTKATESQFSKLGESSTPHVPDPSPEYSTPWAGLAALFCGGGALLWLATKK